MSIFNFFKKDTTSSLEDSRREKENSTNCNDMFTRIVEIYANNISATEFDYEPNDGLSSLLNQNLPYVLSEVIKILYRNYEVYIPLFFGDPADPREPYLEFGNPKLIRLGNPTESLLGWHFSRYVHIQLNESYIQEIRVLKRACQNYDEALNNSKGFISMMRMIFFKLSGITSVWQLNAPEYKSIEAFQANMSSNQRSGIGVIGREDSIQDFSPKMDASSTAFHFIKDDVLAKSGLDAMTLWGASGNDNNRLAENEVKFRSIRATLIRPLINKILEKLHLKSTWNFKIDNVQKQKLESEAEKNQMMIIEKYIQLITASSETGLTTVAQELGERLGQYINSSNREGILNDIYNLNIRNLKNIQKEVLQGEVNENTKS